jgi:cytochrome c peroxidase
MAAYVRSLHPMNSAFDDFLRDGAEVSAAAGTMSAGAVRGANLFMGKAQCATCHFIPLFNGLIPPDYAVTEFEVLGTTADDHLDRPRLSPDSGRFGSYPLPFFRGAFKTPTVRNAALTAPYMHNGGFRSLETVVDFYNRGGGAGLGLSVPEQTLSADSLRLSVGEMNDIVLFIHTLTDSPDPAP